MDCYLRAQGNVFSVCFRYENGDRKYAKRDVITDFSDGSRRRLLKYLRSCRARYRVIGTLTYPAGFDASAFRSHWRAFSARWRREFGNLRGASMFWFLEFQSNGQPHFHFYSTHYIEHGWLATAWYSICKTGNPAHFRAGVSVEGIRKRGGYIAYAAKYAGKKGEQKTLPDVFKDSGVGRWWGVVGERECVSATIKVDSWDYHRFELFRLSEMANMIAKEPVFDDYGCKVWFFSDKSQFSRILRGMKYASKVLQQAEKAHRAEIYRQRRG